MATINGDLVEMDAQAGNEDVNGASAGVKEGTDLSGEQQMEVGGQPEGQEKDGSESDSDGDEDGSHHKSGKFSSERTGVISLAPTTARDKIPDKLEINEEQAAQIQQYVADKTNKGRGKMRGLGRAGPGRGRLGVKPGVGTQPNQQFLLGQILQGIISQQNRMQFPNGPPNRGPFPAGSSGPFPFRPFSGGPNNQRGPSLLGSGPPRGPFQAGLLNTPIRGQPRGPLFNLPQGRFPGTPDQRGQFLRGPQALAPQGMPQMGPRSILGPSPNLQRPQFGQQPLLMGQQRVRTPLPGPRSHGPRPPLLNAGPGMGFVRPGMAPQDPSVPSLINQVANALKTSLELQHMRPGQPSPLMGPNMRAGPQPRLGAANVGRFQRPGLMPPPRFMGRPLGSGGPAVNQALIRGIAQMLGKPNTFMNPRFPGQQASFGRSMFGRPRMNLPLQQRKAKALLEKAKQTQNKQATTVPMKLTGIKRKSTGEDDVPNKVVKPAEDTPEASETPTSSVVEADTGSRGEVIQKMEELAVQEEAGTSNKKTGSNSKEGKTLDKILENSQSENKLSKDRSPTVNQSVTTQRKSQPLLPKPPLLSASNSPQQGFQARTVITQPRFGGASSLSLATQPRFGGASSLNLATQPRFGGASSLSQKNPASNLVAGFLEQFSKNLSKFQQACFSNQVNNPQTNQFNAAQTNFGTRNTTPVTLQNLNVSASYRGSQLGTDPTSAGQAYSLANTLLSNVANQAQRQASSAPTQTQQQQQQFSSHYTPSSSALSSQSYSSYSQFNQSNNTQFNHSNNSQLGQSDSAASSFKQGDQNISNYQSSTYLSQQYGTQTENPSEESSNYSQAVSSHYHYSQGPQLYRTPTTSQYQNTASQYQSSTNPQYETSSVSQYEGSVASNYQTSQASHYQPSLGSQYQTSSSSNYETSTPQFHGSSSFQYQTSTSPQYQNTATSQYQTSSNPQLQNQSASQYLTSSSSQFQSPSASQYETSSSSQYQNSSKYQNSSQYQNSLSSQFQNTSQYQTSAPSQYQTSSASQYHDPSVSLYSTSSSHQSSAGYTQDQTQLQSQNYLTYNTSSDMYYQQMENGYYA